MMKNISNLMQSYSEICLLYPHIFSVFVSLKEFIADKVFETISKHYKAFNGYIISYKYVLS